MSPKTVAFAAGVPLTRSTLFTANRTSALSLSTSTTPRVSVARRNAQPARMDLEAVAVKTYDVEITMYGETYNVPIAEDQTFLEGMEEFGLTVPNSCRAGVCITCAAKVLEGEVDLGQACISDDLKDDGYVLTCSGFPIMEGTRLELHHFDDAYDQQYGQFEKDKKQ